VRVFWVHSGHIGQRTNAPRPKLPVQLMSEVAGSASVFADQGRSAALRAAATPELHNGQRTGTASTKPTEPLNVASSTVRLSVHRPFDSLN
jgi:hypothetical protein